MHDKHSCFIRYYSRSEPTCVTPSQLNTTAVLESACPLYIMTAYTSSLVPDLLHHSSGSTGSTCCNLIKEHVYPVLHDWLP